MKDLSRRLKTNKNKQDTIFLLIVMGTQFELKYYVLQGSEELRCSSHDHQWWKPETIRERIGSLREMIQL